MNSILLQDTQLMTQLGGGLVLLLVVFVLLLRRRKTRELRSLANEVKILAVRYIKDVRLPDAYGGDVHIDYLLHTDRAIYVLTVQNYPGIMFGGEKIDHWTQVYQHKSYKFDNPLPYLQLCTAAVQYLVPGIPVLGRVVFTQAGEFPKGIPTDVVMTDGLLESIRNEEKGMSPIERNGIENAWKKLTEEAPGQVSVSDERVCLSRRQSEI